MLRISAPSLLWRSNPSHNNDQHSAVINSYIRDLQQLFPEVTINQTCHWSVPVYVYIDGVLNAGRYDVDTARGSHNVAYKLITRLEYLLDKYGKTMDYVETTVGDLVSEGTLRLGIASGGIYSSFIGIHIWCSIRTLAKLCTIRDLEAPRSVIPSIADISLEAYVSYNY